MAFAPSLDGLDPFFTIRPCFGPSCGTFTGPRLHSQVTASLEAEIKGSFGGKNQLPVTITREPGDRTRAYRHSYAARSVSTPVSPGTMTIYLLNKAVTGTF